MLAEKIDVTTLGTGYVMDMHKRFTWMLEQLGRDTPTAKVIELHEE